MVADPDPDHTDPLQVTVGLLEQVAHQFVQATLDRHLGGGRDGLCQGLDEGCGSPSALLLAVGAAFPPGREGGGEGQRHKGLAEADFGWGTGQIREC